MKKFLLSLSLVAALAAPAMAQSSYDASASNVAAGGNSGVASSGSANDFTDQSGNPGVDATITNSIVRNDPVNHPTVQRGDQGEYFGANGR